MKQPVTINLEHFFAKRLYPLALGISLLISLLFPVTFYLVEYQGLKRSATLYAQNTAEQLKGVIIETRALWKYQIYRFAELTRDLSNDKEVILIRVFDERGAPISNYHFASEAASSWWNRHPPEGTAPIIFNNRHLGRVSIGVSQQRLLLETAALFAVSVATGLLLGSLTYFFPLNVVRKLEAELQDLFDRLRKAGRDSDQLRQAAQASERRLRELIEGLDAIVWEADPGEGRFTFVSHQGEELFRIGVEQWLAGDDFFAGQIAPADRERVVAAYRQTCRTGASRQLEYRRLAADGSPVWIQDNLRLVTDDQQKCQLRGVMVDISTKRTADEALRQANTELTHSIDALERRNREISHLHELGEMLQLCRNLDEAYHIVSIAVRNLFRTEAGAIYMLNDAGRRYELAIDWGKQPSHPTAFPVETCRARRRDEPFAAEPAQPRCSNTNCSFSRDYVCIPMVAQGDTMGLLNLKSPDLHGHSELNSGAGHSPDLQLAVTVAEHVALAIANLKLRETLRDQSIHDALTGLFNRRFMEEALAREISVAQRRGSAFSLIMIDLDHFKRVNDTFGHDAGDTLLREFGIFLLSNVREYDIACRYGGEEFICILPETLPEHAEERAEELRDRIAARRFEHLGRALGRVTMSIGVAAYPHHGSTKDRLFKAVDEALYRAKEDGRDRVCLAKTPPASAAGSEGATSAMPGT
ncbi:hypothetical protein GURASL_27440 [Geotalea uraniireducens]|uniref:diguanylate cyclase n=1 Tax=Geotalea uraniireducens TaxID=351604 RepID=A0ABM8EN32_9BACT|nr:diguanylate cyclase [Geotalea uraniireducens]BDV43821.1 hypothetical protein GURASL_27440 [Geotalea uraniireducens]